MCEGFKYYFPPNSKEYIFYPPLLPVKALTAALYCRPLAGQIIYHTPKKGNVITRPGSLSNFLALSTYIFLQLTLIFIVDESKRGIEKRLIVGIGHREEGHWTN